MVDCRQQKRSIMVFKYDGVVLMRWTPSCELCGMAPCSNEIHIANSLLLSCQTRAWKRLVNVSDRHIRGTDALAKAGSEMFRLRSPSPRPVGSVDTRALVPHHPVSHEADSIGGNQAHEPARSWPIRNSISIQATGGAPLTLLPTWLVT